MDKKIYGRLLSLIMALVLLVSETAFADTVRPEASATVNAEIEYMLSQGNYAFGEVLALIKESGSGDVNFLGASGDSDDLLSSGKTIMDLSMETALESLGETSSDNMFLGAAPSSGARIVSIKSDTLSTRQLMYKLYGDSRVMAVQPNYFHEIQDVSATKEDISGVLEVSEVINAAEVLEVSEVSEVSEITEVTEVVEVSGNASSEGAVSSALLYGTGPSSYPDLTGYQWGFSNDDDFNALVHNGETRKDGFKMGIENWNNPSADKNATGYVVVLDTGVDYTNPDLENVMADLTSEQLNGTNGGPHGYNSYADRTGIGDPGDPKDVNGHGTHCAGIIAAEWNDFGTSGICNGVRIIAVAAAQPQSNSFSDIDLLYGYSFISQLRDNGVDVVAVNNSWGASGKCNPVFNAAVTKVGEQGIISIFATGNEGKDLDIAAYSAWGLYNNPYVVTVGSAKQDGTRSSFSNYGQDTCDVYGPGSEIMSTVPASMSEYYLSIADPDPIYRNEFSSGDNSLTVKQGSGDDIQNLVKGNLTADTIISKGQQSAAWDNIPYTVDPDTSSLKITLNNDIISSGCINLFIPVKKTELEKISNISFCACYDGDQDCEVNPVLYWADKQCVYSGDTSTLYTGLKKEEINYFYSVDSEWDQIAIPIETQKPNRTGLDPHLLAISHDENTADVVVALMIKATPGGTPGNLYIDAVGLGTEGTCWALMDGTSMAAPAVTGAAAIVARIQQGNGEELYGELSALHRANYLKSHILAMTDGENTSRQGGMVNLSVPDSELTPVINEAVTDPDSSVLTLKGAYFGNESGSVTVGGHSCQVTSWADEEIAAAIPSDVMSGDLCVCVTAANGKKSTLKIRHQSPNGITAFPSIIPSPATQLNNHYLTGLLVPNIRLGLLNGSILATEDSLYAILPDSIDIYSTELLCCDLYENEWRKVCDLDMSSILYSSMTEMDGIVYVYLTGMGHGLRNKNFLLAYDPASNEIEEIDISDTGNAFYGAGIINAGGTLLLIGGSDAYDVPTEKDNVAELNIDNKKATLTVTGDFYVTDGTNKYGLRSHQLAYFDGDVYASGGIYYKDSQCQLNPYMTRLSFDEGGGWTCTDMSSRLPARVLKDSAYYQPTYGLTATDEGLFIVGATVKDENGEISANDTYVLSSRDSSFEPWDMAFCLGQTAYTISTSYDGIIYAMAESRIAAGESGNIYIAATKEKEKFTVTFDTEGGSFVSGEYAGLSVAECHVRPGGTIEKPDDPEKDGYKFIAWMYKNGEGKPEAFNFDTPINGDLTLYADWKENDKPEPDPKPDPKPVPRDSQDEDYTLSAIQKLSPLAGASSISVRWSVSKNGIWSASYGGQSLKDTFANITYNGKTYWYHFNKNGDMDTGWLFVNGNWYYLSTEHDGFYGRVLTGWFTDRYDQYTYYFDSNGRMLVGWRYIDGDWYYFNTDAIASYSVIDGKWVYTNTAVRPYGAMYRNEMTPDGYFVDENGKWKK